MIWHVHVIHQRRPTDGNSLLEMWYASRTAGARGLAKQLLTKWRGPFCIVERLSDVTFRIRENKTGVQRVVHANRLRTYRAAARHGDAAERRERTGNADCEGVNGSPGQDDSGESCPATVSGGEDTCPEKTNEVVMLALLEELENVAAARVSSGVRPHPRGHAYALRSRGALIG